MTTHATVRVGQPLTAREHEILATYARLGSLKDAAEALGISLHTVKNAASRAYAKLGVVNAISAFHRLGWLWVPTTDAAETGRLRTQILGIRSEVDALLGRFRGLMGPSAQAGMAASS